MDVKVPVFCKVLHTVRKIVSQAGYVFTYQESSLKTCWAQSSLVV